MRRGGESPAGRQAQDCSRRRERNEEKYLSIVFYAGREKEGLPTHICKRLPTPLSHKKAHRDGTSEKRGLTVGWPLAKLMMRLSCALLPHGAFPVQSEFLSLFFVWQHHGGSTGGLVQIMSTDTRRRQQKRLNTCR